MATFSRANTVLEIPMAGCGVHLHVLGSVRSRHGAPFSRVYDGLTHTLAITVREIAEYMNMQFVTFQMLPYWVGSDRYPECTSKCGKAHSICGLYRCNQPSWEQPGRRPFFQLHSKLSLATVSSALETLLRHPHWIIHHRSHILF